MILHDLAPITWKREHKPISSLSKERLMVALAFGQSNSANYGLGLKRAGEGVFNFYQDSLYLAEDPMLGADGDGASVWPLLGDLLIASRYYDNVVFATIGVSGSTVSRWQPGGDLHPSLIATLQSLRVKGLKVTHLLWHQGETDASISTSKDDYKKSFRQMLKSIRQLDIDVPIYVSIATKYQGSPKNHAIRSAQIELAQQADSILPGPDSDQLENSYRIDGTHFTRAGLDQLARLWFNQLVITRETEKF